MMTRRALLLLAVPPDPLAKLQAPWNRFAAGVAQGKIDLKALESVVREGARLLGLRIS